MRTRKSMQADSLIFWHKHSGTYQLGQDALGNRYSADKWQSGWHLAVNDMPYGGPAFATLTELKAAAEIIAKERKAQ